MPEARRRYRPTGRPSVRSSSPWSGSIPGLSGQVIDDDGALHKFVNVYLNDDDVRYLSALDTPVEDSDEISILPAVAGGATVSGRPVTR